MFFVFHRIKKMFWLWSDVDSWSSNNVKYSYWGRTYFIIVSGFVQLNINIPSHVWFSDRHFNYRETHALVSLDYGFNDKWWDTSGICHWRRCLCKLSRWNGLCRNERNCYFSPTILFQSHMAYAVVVVFPVKHKKTILKESSHSSFIHALHLTVILLCYWSLLELDRLGHCRP